ncbi:MAG: Holliday junction resolvase RuvX [Tenericutes bacterium HGW-Tenericutes-6]|jgi:putative Holliday junction resolvase|nr:MAG: Holliday junction resolvase RuvX [Tenericutes bacterium HGW-Tenericutes-6]
MSTYFGLDLGSKTVGISLSTSGVIASTYQTIRFKENDYHEAAKMVLKLAEKEMVDTIVLGLPKHMNNDLGIRGEISMQFKTLLEQNKALNVILWDERLSTKSALSAMIKGNEQRKNQKQKKDELAAVIILQNYLDYIRRSNT